MIDTLQKELLKLQDNLQTIEFKINKTDFKWYFRYMTILEKSRINQMAVKQITEVREDGSKNVRYELQDDLIPIYTILEKALDKEGKRLFSHTNKEHFKIVSNLPYGLLADIAYILSEDIFGNMKGKNNGE